MKRWMLLLFVVLFLSGSVWGYHWWHGPAQSATVTTSDQTEQGVLGSESKLLPWQTEYFATRYPSNLRVLTSNEIAQGLTLGQYLLGSTSLEQTDQLAVTVGNLQGLRLAELPAIKLRQQQTGTYQATTRSFTPSGGFVFSRSDTYETAVFWQEGGRYAAVVVSGSSVRQAELEQSLQAVITDWEWR